MSKKNHQILDSLIQNIENNVTEFIDNAPLTKYVQHSCKVSDLSRERLLGVITSSDSYTFETTESGTLLIYYNVKAPIEVDEQEKNSLENIRIAQLQLVEKLKEAKNMQNSLYKMMRDFKYGDQ